SRDDDGIEASPIEQVIEVLLALYFGIDQAQVLETLLADVAHHLQGALRERPEIADEVGAPIAATDNTDFNLFFHIPPQLAADQSERQTAGQSGRQSKRA